MLIACVSVVFNVHNLYSQEILEDIGEQVLMNGDASSYQWENLLEELADLKENPLPINKATKDQLARFPFLSDELIENILYYLYKYGPMLTEKELLMVEDMDLQTIRYLKPFITFEQPEKEEFKLSLNHLSTYGKHELSTRVDIPFYAKKGYQPIASEEIKENPNKRYLGYSFYHHLR